MRLLYITSRLPFPLNKGDRLRAYYQLKYLNERHEVYLVCLNDEGPVSQEQLSTVKSLSTKHTIIDLNKMGIAKRLVGATVGSVLPYQVHYFHSSYGQRLINEIIARFQPDHIFAQLIRTAEYIRSASVLKTLDMMDALSMGMYRRSSISSFPKNLIFKSEAKRLLAYEKDVIKDFDHVIMISENDRSIFEKEESAKIGVVPNGIGTQFLDEYVTPKKYDVSFVGNLSYAPNIEAAVYLVKKILPHLLEEKQDIKVVIAGANPTSKILNLANKHVEILTNLEDIRYAYASSKVFVAPMNIGSGLQNKLLEAMSLGVPCVTTTLANDALMAQPDIEVLVADDAKSLSTKILSVLNDPHLAAVLSTNARNLIRGKYRWERMNEQIEKIILNNT